MKPRERNKILFKDEVSARVEDFTKWLMTAFFEDLQTAFEAESDKERDRINAEWLEGFVITAADGVLIASWESLPCPDSQRIRATAISKNVFNGRIYQEFGVSLN